MLPTTPPKSIVYSIKDGTDGWPVYSLQTGLNSARSFVNGGWSVLARDGVFGSATKDAVTRFQQAYSLTADGIAGPATQRKIIEILDRAAHNAVPGLPTGLMRGWVEGEGANVLAAVNWSIPGGVDCGPMQYRVYGPPYNFTDLGNAFNPLFSMEQAAREFLDRADWFLAQPGVKSRSDKAEFSKRLAILAHNWPAGARDIALDGKLTNPDGPATWVPAGVKFPDGTVVNTRQEWCDFYSLGRGSFKGTIPKYVTNWS